MEELSLDSQIEAVLFWKGEPQSIKKLADSLGKNEEDIKSALQTLKERINGRGVELIYKDDEVMLGTATKLSHIIERLTKEELVKDLGKAGLETISIIAYKGPISRAEIDYIRGVQSNFILRNLQIRGLVEKISNPKDARSFLYQPTFELLQFLGVSKIQDLPEFEKVKAEFEQNAEVQAVQADSVSGPVSETAKPVELAEDLAEENDNLENQ
jgi:segregation and condensation protein B